MDRKVKLRITEHEQGVIANSLLEWKNARIRDGLYTDAIDDVLYKVLKKKLKRSWIK